MHQIRPKIKKSSLDLALDENENIKFDGLQCGQCEIHFPTLEQYTTHECAIKDGNIGP
jgi:hypothetical protein